MSAAPIRRSVVVLVGAILALAGCSTPAGSTSSAPSSGAEGTVKVTLTEWAVVLDKDTAPAGNVTFQVTNAGTQFKHEFVVIKTDLAPADLPADETGKVDEAGAGISFIGEVEELEIGASQTASFDLTAGKYVLICNIVEAAGGHQSHYNEGMRVAFTVS
jgi:iron uptake system component EfeO